MKKINEIDLLSELIAIDSSNPGPFENEIAKFLASLAGECGFESKIYESAVAYIPIYKRTIIFIEIMLMYTLLRTCSQSKQYSLETTCSERISSYLRT
jgi:hypothetical protein